MRILITGGFGYIGGRIAQHLQEFGNNILLGSRYDGAPADWLPRAEVVQTEWSDGSLLEQICRGVDVVIHAAGMNAGDCAADPVAALECNGLFTARLVRAATSAGVKRFIYLSTAHVYGSPLAGIITEETCPGNLHPYTTSHLAGESVVLAANHNRNILGIVLRLSNAFGVPAHKDVNCWMLLVNDLCRQAVETGIMVLHSNGRQLRDFVSIDSVCSVVTSLITEERLVRINRIINIGSGKAISVIAMAETIQVRCSVILGYMPIIDRPTFEQGEVASVLEYKTQRLDELGLKLREDLISEIDALLQFCRANFTTEVI